jgi:hypothetical protein
MTNVMHVVLGEIKAQNPNLIERLAQKSMCEHPDERQTLYGDLLDWLRDMYSYCLSGMDRDELAKHIIGDYVVHHPGSLRITLK